MVENKDFLESWRNWESKNSDRLKILYDHYIITPLLQILAITPTKIFVVSAHTYTFLADDTSSAIYDQEIKQVIVKENSDLNSLLSTIFHESTHFAMDIIFKNKTAPYDLLDEKTWNLCDLMIDRTKGKIKNLDVTPFTPLFVLVDVFQSYSWTKWPSEIVARVPQTIAWFGTEATLQEPYKFPELYRFYLGHILSSMSQYLEKQQHLSPKYIKSSDSERAKILAKLNLLEKYKLNPLDNDHIKHWSSLVREDKPPKMIQNIMDAIKPNLSTDTAEALEKIIMGQHSASKEEIIKLLRAAPASMKRNLSVLCPFLFVHGAEMGPIEQGNTVLHIVLHPSLKWIYREDEEIPPAKVLSIIQLLFAHRAPDINAKNSIGQTPLHIAFRQEMNNLIIYKFLLSRKEINVNLTDQAGYTALYYIIMAAMDKLNQRHSLFFLSGLWDQNDRIKDHTEIIKSFINSGADLDQKQGKGKITLRQLMLKGGEALSALSCMAEEKTSTPLTLSPSKKPTPTTSLDNHFNNHF